LRFKKIDIMKIKHAVCLLVFLIGSATTQAGKPNIVFIMADDLGWADVGYNGE